MQSLDTQESAGALIEQKLRTFVERLSGGQVTAMQRLPRWRPAWNLDVRRGEEVLRLHIRGERGGDVSPFPELRREADILSLLGEQGIPVPHIHGFCEDPPAIVMDLVPGTRDVGTAASDDERRALARQYVRAMAAMHRLPLEPFVAKGVRLPQGTDEISLAGLEAYYPLYLRNKTRPQPLAEFALGWLRRNVPRHRTRAAFVQYDSGQYLFADGKLNALYDFEFAMIGDPLADLASARMRDNYEPLGETFSELYRYYQEVSDEPADADVVRYHTVLFSTVSTMQFSATVATPQPGDPHDTYIEFDLARAGLPTSYGMERLFQDNPQLPLRPLPAQRFGYSKNQHAEATGQALSMVISDLSETSIPVVGQLLGFLNQFDDWSVRAAATGRPAPDLVAICMD